MVYFTKDETTLGGNGDKKGQRVCWYYNKGTVSRDQDIKMYDKNIIEKKQIQIAAFSTQYSVDLKESFTNNLGNGTNYYCKIIN